MGLLDNIRRRASRMAQRGALADRYPDVARREHLVTGAYEAPDLSQNFQSYGDVYRSHTWTRKAIGVVATSLKALPQYVLDANGKALLQHRITGLLASPNDSEDASAFRESNIIHSLLGGEIPIEIVPDKQGRPAQLWARRPDWITILPDAERPAYPRVALYCYYDPDVVPSSVTAEQRRQYAIDIDPRYMIFDKFANPLSKWRGLAPITAVRNGITIDLFAQSWSRTFLAGGARPDFAILSPQPLTATERVALEDQFMAKFAGPGGWHRPAVLDDGTEIKPFSWAPKDIEWLQQREIARDEVAAIFGVPDEIMGYGRDTYENFSTAHGVLWTLTLKPWQDRYDQVLTRHFRMLGALGAGESIATDFSGVGALQEDDAPRIEKAGKLWAMGVPFNTLDERLSLGIGPIEGGEIGYLPSGLTPADLATGIVPATNAPVPSLGSEPAQLSARRLLPVVRRVRPDDLRRLAEDVLDDAARLANEHSEG